MKMCVKRLIKNTFGRRWQLRPACLRIVHAEIPSAGRHYAHRLLYLRVLDGRLCTMLAMNLKSPKAGTSTNRHAPCAVRAPPVRRHRVFERPRNRTALNLNGCAE
eukprot:5265826-Heterocapsa_arctica.AAC.1